MPERMPSLHDIDLMRIQNDKLAIALQRVTERIVAQGQYGGDQHGPPQGGKVVEEYSQEDMSWEESRNMGTYGGPDAKKRRGVGCSQTIIEIRTNRNIASCSPWPMSQLQPC